MIRDASIRRQDITPIPTEILRLNEAENDIFLEIFTNTYSKITELLSRKV